MQHKWQLVAKSRPITELARLPKYNYPGKYKTNDHYPQMSKYLRFYTKKTFGTITDFNPNESKITIHMFAKLPSFLFLEDCNYIIKFIHLRKLK